jgi:tetratricopeptide (TPR) repeat protein
MKSLYNLNKVLRPGERSLLRHMYGRSTNNEDKLRLRLFNLISSVEEQTDHQAIVGIEHKGGRSAFSHLKKRLREDMLNVLLLQESDKRFGESFRVAAFDCRKKLAQAYVLMFRGEYSEGLALLRRAAQIAKTFELPLERAQTDLLIRETLHTLRDRGHLDGINAEIREDLDLAISMNRAEELSLVLSAPQFFRGGKADGQEEMTMEKAMVEIEDIYRKKHLTRIGFWYFLARTEHHASVGQYAEVIRYGEDFIRLVESSPAVRSKNNIAGVNQTIGYAHLHQGSYSDAKRYLQVAVDMFRDGGVNQLRCLDFLFRAQYLNGDLALAEDIVKRALGHPKVSGNERGLARWYFFKSLVALKAGDRQVAFREVNRSAALQRGVDAWNLHHRLADLAIAVETDDFDWLEFKVESARKFVARTPTLKNKRVTDLLRLFNILARLGVNDFIKDKTAQKLLAELTSAESNAQWDPTGPELFRADLWMKGLTARPEN